MKLSLFTNVPVLFFERSFTDETVCSSGGSGNTFSYSPLNTCFSVSNNPNCQSQKMISCGSTVDYTQYKDKECKDVYQSLSGAVYKCFKATSGNATLYNSVQCSSR